MLQNLSLSPLIATMIFVLAILAGHRYRKIWKAEGPRWQLWVSGVIAAVCLLILAFVQVVPNP